VVRWWGSEVVEVTCQPILTTPPPHHPVLIVAPSGSAATGSDAGLALRDDGPATLRPSLIRGVLRHQHIAGAVASLISHAVCSLVGIHRR
jgi:hypothetical protein